MTVVLAFGWVSHIQAAEPADRERRLNTITVTALPPDKGALHINPIIRRPQDFQRPGFPEIELVFVPVAIKEGALSPLVGEENCEYLRRVTEAFCSPQAVSPST